MRSNFILLGNQTVQELGLRVTMYPGQKRLTQSFVVLLVEKPSTSLEMDHWSVLLIGEEKCQYKVMR